MWVRTAAEADLKAVHELLRATWHATFDDILGVEVASAVTAVGHSLDALKDNLKHPYSEFIVADNGEGRIDGMAFALQINETTAFLHQLYVRPAAHAQGIGTMLLAEVEMAFPDVKAIRLEVVEKNTRAVEFYQRKGYVQVERREIWGDLNCPQPLLVLEKVVAGWSM